MPEGPVPAAFARASLACRPPRRPRRRRGNSAAIAAQSASTVTTAAWIAASSAHPSGLRRPARSVSRSRSSGVRARLATRWSSSANCCRNRLACSAPSVLPSSEWSSTMTTGGATGAAGVWGRDCCCRRGVGRTSSSLVLDRSAGSRTSDAQSKFKSGCVCSSASITSVSSARRPRCTCDGDRNRYSTRPRCPPFVARYACITSVDS